MNTPSTKNNQQCSTNTVFSTKTVRNILLEHDLKDTIKKLDQSTHTAAQAAQAIDCEIDQIAKSLIFQTVKDKQGILVITSGANRVDTTKVGKAFGEKVKMASPKFVKELSGYSVGGVPPFGHKSQIQTFIDKHLTTFDLIWAAAGSSNSIFSISPQKLEEITKATIIEVA
jgi:Cys-tRNA(Pro) deacylase